MAREEFISGFAVSDAGIARRVVLEDGFAMARSFSDTNGSWDDRFVKLRGEVVGDFFNDLAREVGAAVIHRHEDAFETYLWVRTSFSNLLDDLNDFGKSL